VTIKVVTSERIIGASYRTARLVNLRNGSRVTVRVTYDAATHVLRIDPRTSLKARTWYRVSLLSGIHDQAGNRLVGVTWRFLTR
jgi:YD repeat-containing protein